MNTASLDIAAGVPNSACANVLLMHYMNMCVT